MSGSQQFDAEVRQSGAYIDKGYFPETAHLEATCVMHPKEYLNRELLNNGGVTFGLDGIRRLRTREIVSEPIVRHNTEFIQSYSTLVLNQITKKTGIIYPADTSLIVQCSLNTLYTPEEWEMLLIEVKRNLPNHTFREIFMYDTVTEYSCNL